PQERYRLHLAIRHASAVVVLSVLNMHDYGMGVETAATLKLSAVLSGLSYALDLTEGHPRGHASRSCLIGMRIARALGLPPDDQSNLFYALLLKDAGCSSNAARVFQLFG